MRRTFVLIAAAGWALGLGCGVLATAALSAAPQTNRARVLLEQPELKGLEGHEARLMVVEQAPGATGTRHWHHGHEFAYVLEGTMHFEVDGKTQVFKAGEVAHVPPGAVHRSWNEGDRTRSAFALVLTEKDKPFAVPAE